MRYARRLLRPLACGLALAAFVPAARAQGAAVWIGSSAPTDFVGGTTFRARAFTNTSDRVFIGLLSQLGTPTRDAYGGAWQGLGNPAELTFQAAWNASTRRATFFVSNLSGAARTADVASVVSAAWATSLNGVDGWSFTVDDVADFSVFRLFSRESSASLTSLMWTGGTGSQQLASASSPLTLGNSTQFFTAAMQSDFAMTGTVRFASNGCPNENCRFEMGFGSGTTTTGPTTAPEPRTPVLLAGGLLILTSVAARWRRRA